MDTRLGELAALFVSVCFTFTSLFFEYAAKRIGSLSLNILRLLVALIIFTALSLVLGGELLPFGAGPRAWFWLSLSGLVGFVFGDLFLFQAYVDIGARLTQVIFSAAPLLTALLGYFALGERLSAMSLAGMVVVVLGIILVIYHPARREGKAGTDTAAAVAASSLQKARRARGAAFALLAALGQAGGFVLSKIGAPEFNPFSATQIRVVAGLAGFIVVAALWRRLGEPIAALKDGKAVGALSAGAFFGPFLGVSLGLYAAQRANAGVAATLMGLAPVLIIAPSILIRKEKVAAREVAGAFVAVAGSALLFLA